jgi:hypothetical protein
MPEMIEVQKGSVLQPWDVKVRKRDPETDKWEDDDLSDVTAVTATMTNVKTGVKKFEDQAALVRSVADALLRYEPVAANVDTVGLYLLFFTAIRGGKAQILPHRQANKVYVRVWE